MIREFKNETIIITKEGFFFLKNASRRKAGCQELSLEKLEQWWARMRYRNGGASNIKHPINDNEVRVSKDSFNFRLDEVKAMLHAEGLTFRQDGFIEEGCYM